MAAGWVGNPGRIAGLVEDAGGEGARALRRARRGQVLALVDYERSGGQVAEPLVLAGEKDAHHSHGVDQRELIHDAEEVAGHRLEQADSATGSLDHADLGYSLAGSAAVPEGLEEGEIAPIEGEGDEDEECCGPLLAQLAEVREAGIDYRDDDDDQDDGDQPDEVIDCEGDEATADSGDGHVNVHHLGCFDAKLVPFGVAVQAQ